MYYQVFGRKCKCKLHSESCEPPKLQAEGNCKKNIAIDQANNMIRFGAWKMAEVYQGRTLGKLIYTVVQSDDN